MGLPAYLGEAATRRLSAEVGPGLASFEAAGVAVIVVVLINRPESLDRRVAVDHRAVDADPLVAGEPSARSHIASKKAAETPLATSRGYA